MLTFQRSQEILLLSGELSINHATEARERVLEELAVNPDLELDFSGLVKLDTAGIQVLLWLKREARNQHQPFHPLLSRDGAAQEIVMAELTPRKRQNRDASELAQQEEKNQYLAFVLGGEHFAMNIRTVKEVLQYGSITEVPLMPGFIRGVINLRGAVVPVIDLSVRFGRPPTNVARRTCVVILEAGQAGEEIELGVIVDNVSEVLEIAASEIEPAPSFGSALRSEFISGVGKVGDRFVILLEVNHILSIDEMASHCV